MQGKIPRMIEFRTLPHSIRLYDGIQAAECPGIVGAYPLYFFGGQDLSLLVNGRALPVQNNQFFTIAKGNLSSGYLPLYTYVTPISPGMK